MTHLRDLARSVIEEYIDITVQPDELAKIIFERINEADYGDLVSSLLPGFVRETQGLIRNAKLTSPVEVKSESWVSDPDAGANLTPVPKSLPWKTGRIARTKSMVDQWLDGVMTGANGVRIKRANMTFEDLMAAALIRQNQAGALTTEAYRLEEQAALLKTHNVSTLAELPKTVLAKLVTQ